MHSNVRKRGSHGAKESKVLDDHRVYTCGPRPIDQVEGLGQFVLEHDDVRRQIDARVA